MAFVTTSTVPVKVPDTELSLDTNGTDIALAVTTANDTPLDLVMDGAVVGHLLPVSVNYYAHSAVIHIECAPGHHQFYLQVRSKDGTPANVEILGFTAMEQ